MLNFSDDLLFPAGIWAAVGNGNDGNGNTVRVLLFDGAIAVDDKTGAAPDDLWRCCSPAHYTTG